MNNKNLYIKLCLEQINVVNKNINIVEKTRIVKSIYAYYINKIYKK